MYDLGIVINSLTDRVAKYEIVTQYYPECTSSAKDLVAICPEYRVWNQGP